jgi:hypothetical protein
MSTRREKAEELRRLHAAPEPLVLVNAWDAASARVVAAAPGARAIATASWSIAAAHGYADGEALSREAMIEAVRVVASAVELAVTADLERGYGDARLTLECALEAGAVGCNLEDSDGNDGLWPAEEHAAVVAAARAAGDAADVPLAINARTDVYLRDVIPPEERLVAALERGGAYLDLAHLQQHTPRTHTRKANRGLADPAAQYAPEPKPVPTRPLHRGDDQRARARPAGAAEAVRRRAVEAQRVALGELVDRSVQVHLERPAGGVDRDLARLDVELVRPAAVAG